MQIDSDNENINTNKEQQKSEVKFTNEVGNPPLIVVVQGGKNSGKSTLIRSLVKYYTNQNINYVKGSITIRNSKNQRLTFIECPNDISAMIDLSKIADIALVMIDASVGFEMETFEYLSLLKNHGFTSVMGVLTHMDEFRVNKSLNKLKKQIKKRFLREATDKAKLFYLFGVKNNLYMKMQMHNLARFLKVIKPNVPGFRQNHPYIFADRFDVTFLNSNSNDPEDSVMVSFFGYVRGNNFNKNSTMHINGLGDYSVDYALLNEDPCPIETVEVKGRKKRTLKQKEKFLYAPYCNINSLEYDRNAGYINIPDKFVTFTKGLNESSNIIADEGVGMVRELQNLNNKRGIDEQMGNFDNFEIFEGVDYKESDIKNSKKEEYVNDNNLKKSKNTNSKIKEIVDNFKIKSEPVYYKEPSTNDLIRSIYDYSNYDEQKDNDNNIEDCYKNLKDPEYNLNFYILNVKRKFITGTSFIEGNEASEDEKSEKEDEIKYKNIKKKPFPMENEESPVGPTEEEQEELNKKITQELKPFLNEEYGLFEKGSYIRLDIKNIKKKYVDNFKIDYPIFLSSTNIQENSMGFLKIRFSKHIWHPKILKTNDPIVLSIGWRKFQTTPIYCVEDKNFRLRMIKYTPKFTSCFAVAYGPLLPINVACTAIQNYSDDSDVQHFRICGTGDLIEVNQNFEIFKKLKLIGEPMEIFKKTAFIKGMFNSNMEVARYIGAKINTVSGIRGQIKKQLNIQPEGCFRATFEDKILKSDIVFLKTWNQVDPQKFYNPIISYGKMKLLRTMAQLRKDYDLDLVQNKDSDYKDIHREQRVFPSLMISKSLENSLPFKSKNKINSAVIGKSIKYEEDDTFILKKLNLPHNKPLKNILTEKEKSVYSMLQRLQTIKNLKDKKTKEGAKEFEKKKLTEEEKEEKLKKKRNREKMIKNIKKRSSHK